jgi:hypothetical protein
MVQNGRPGGKLAYRASARPLTAATPLHLHRGRLFQARAVCGALPSALRTHGQDLPRRMCCNFVVEPKVGVDDRKLSSSQRTDRE